MKKYFSYRDIITYTILSISILGCNSGIQNNSNLQKIQAPTQAQLLTAGCGEEGPSNLIIQEANGTPLVATFNLGISRGVKASVICVNGNSFDVTAMSYWDSNDHNIITVDNDLSKGYINTHNTGSAIITVSYLDEKLTASQKITVLDAALKNISISLSRPQIAIGEKTTPTIEGVYTNNTTSPIKNAVLSSSDESIAKIDGQNIIGLKPGIAKISALIDGYTSTIDIEILPAKITGIILDPKNQYLFTTGIPQPTIIKAKLLLSDGNILDIPKNDFDTTFKTQCYLQKSALDTSIPFIASQDGCTISSTIESGENKIVYTYSILDQNHNIVQKFESSAILKSTDEDIKQITLKLDDSIQQNKTMFVGEVYRYHIYATLKNGSTVDITKVIPLKTSLSYNNTDISQKIITGNTGYIGGSQGTDDNNGGIIKITDYVFKDDAKNYKVKLLLNASLSSYTTRFNEEITIIPNVLSIYQLSSYFANDIYNKKLNATDKKHFSTFSGLDSTGKIIFTNASDLLSKLNASQLSASALNDKNETLSFKSISDNTVDIAIDTTIPRINEIYSDSDDDSMTIMSIGCNYDTQSVQTISTASKSKEISSTDSVSKGFAVGMEIGTEVEASLPFIAKAKNSIKISTSYNQSWSNSNTTSQTYSLASQNVTLNPEGRTVVIQKVYKTKIGLTGKFSLPLTDNSCIPFNVNGNVQGLTLSSPACIKYSDIANNLDDPTFNKLFDGSNKLSFYANYASNELSDVTTNTIAVYVYNKGDAGYDSINCNVEKPPQKTVTKTNDIKLSYKNLVKSQTFSK